ncbi:peptidyl-prolyl cis-trans isomerase [Paenibacillus donghaensis]|uniref:peptidylprolyl isomerase n=1 Tax=Paenibacillus donghaensis TaxID=414771 RepID=UPI00188371A8|nr:peptidylprolyl isomerase [Paenibacillus donghaensis]MBE9916186.1 peptidyl-prolyl cis-trans isomerase [Paenibacillus donghaensis]
MAEKKRLRVKTKWTIAGLLVLTVCTTAAFAKGGLKADEQGEEVMATVDGIPVTVPEYNRAIQMNKSRIMNYFHEKYSAEQTPSFWTTSFAGEIPLEILKKTALNESVNIKVRQMAAKEQGVLKDISYQGFLNQLEQENERRTKAAANHQIIYGPVQYNEDAYFEYIMTNAATAVKQKLDKKLKPGEQTLKSFYDAHKKELYLNPGDVKVLSISASYLDSRQQIDLGKKEQVRERLEEAAVKLAAGTSFAEAAKAYSDQGTEQEIVFHLGNERQNSRSPVAGAAARMKPGDMSGIVDENGRLYLLKCVAKTEPGTAYQAFGENKEQVRKDYIDNEYEEIIRNKLSEADIHVNEERYNSWNFNHIQ